MDLNARGRYAVMAMADLALHGGSGAVPLGDIAGRQQIPAAYLEQIFLKLRRAGLIESERGRAGGYRLARPAGRIAIADVMAAAEESVAMTRCNVHGASGCVQHERCLTHDLWDALTDQIVYYLQIVSLQDVIDGKVRRGPIGEAAE